MMESFIIVLVVSSWVMGIMLPASLIFLTWITPQSVIERYVRPPHFSEFEAVAYRYYPTSLIRTMLFSMAISVPFFRRFRKFGDMQKQVPLWFNIASRIFVYCIFGYSVLCLATMAVLVVMIKMDIAPAL